MMDFLKSFPSVTREQYMWEWTVPQIRLGALDCSHVEYLSEAQAKEERKRRRIALKYDDAMTLANDLGIPIF